MSEKIIDLKQATLNSLVERFGQLTEAIKASNTRYTALSTRMDEGFSRLETRIVDSEKRLTQRINETHSELLLATNQILTMQDQVWKLLHQREEELP